MLMFIPTYGILLLIRIFAVITKYTVLDEQRCEAKEGKSQRRNPHSITRWATLHRNPPNICIKIILIAIQIECLHRTKFIDPDRNLDSELDNFAPC